jgi:hypothetical protein
VLLWVDFFSASWLSEPAASLSTFSELAVLLWVDFFSASWLSEPAASLWSVLLWTMLLPDTLRLRPSSSAEA